MPEHDDWFDRFVQTWGRDVSVNVIVDHINGLDIPARISAEIAARHGHDLIQYLAPLPQLEPSVVDMTDVTKEAERQFGLQLQMCRRSSFNPTTGRFYAYCPAWSPDPGNYRRSLWQEAGLSQGPSTWADLLEGGTSIQRKRAVHVGIGMSPEPDSNMALLALIWSFGGAVQDENERVVIDSDETVMAVEFIRKLFRQSMTDAVFSWNPASNNQGFIAGQLSYILNSISAYRTAQTINPDVADDLFFSPALKGPSAQLAPAHVVYNWIVPKHAQNVDTAKEFLLHYTRNFELATKHSQLYDFPAFGGLVPKLGEWLMNDPHGSRPSSKLAVLRDSMHWSTNVGHPGSSNPAIGEMFATSIIPNMMAKAARGDLSPKDAIIDAKAQLQQIFDRWRRKGFISG